MVGTVRAARPGRPRVLAAAAFAAGLTVSGALTFGALGAIGSLLRPGRGFLVAAAVLAGAAVLADLAGLRVRPQLRLQVPERWRQTMPLPRALFLYGLLLGTGLTTFVAAAAAWALLPLSVTLASVPAGVVVGLSFAAGRALPVLAVRDETALAERPRGLRALRILAAASLALALAAGEARAAQVASPGGDPSAEAADLVWQVPGVGGFLLRNGQQTQLPGNDPALGGTRIAWHAGDEVTIADSTTLQPVLQLAIPGVEKLAVSDEWLAYRVRLANGKEELRAFALADPTTTTVLTHARARGYLGRPSLSGDLVVYHLAGPAGSGLFSFDLATGKRRRLRFSTQAQLLSPARLGSKLLYVRISRCSQELRLGPLDGNGAGRVLYKLPPLAGEDAGHERGHTHQGEHLPCTPKPKPTARMLWTTALSGTTAYVTVLRPGSGGQTTPTLLALNRS
ncbi:MAG: hypothetical protein E6G24_08655 [Actinobacteria bacterium]|nr:MAG: hypothetical protein E6G24_08655 [Actinomycetota bacterium]